MKHAALALVLLMLPARLAHAQSADVSSSPAPGEMPVIAVSATPPPPPTGPAPYAPQPAYVPQSAYVPHGAVPYTGGPIPPGTHVEQRSMRGLAIAGAACFGAMYISSVVAAALSPGANVGWMYAPVIGPVVFVANSPGAPGFAVGVMVVDTALQALGVAGFIAGLVVHRPFVVWGPPSASNRPHRSLAIAPLVSPYGAGFGLTLTME